MKIKLQLIIWLLISSVGFAQPQQYAAPKPKLITKADVPQSTEEMRVAWMFPQESFRMAKQYDKVEIGIDLPDSIKYRMHGFFNQQAGMETLNPFNRHDIDITVQFFVNGELEKTVDAFYYEEYQRNLSMGLWLEDTTAYNFRVRFSPKKKGEYTANILVEATGFPDISTSVNFNVVASDHKGLLERGLNHKHMRYSETKESFIGVGQVIQGTIWDDWFHMGRASGPGSFMPVYGALRAMHAAGGNYTRFVSGPWFLQLEWEALGNYQPKMRHAWEFDRINDKCDQFNIYYMFCPLLHSPLESRTGEHANMFPGIRWEEYCYNDNDVNPSRYAQEEKLGVTKPEDFYTNENAFDAQQNHFRYLVSRWGYSTSLAGWQLMSETDQTCNYRDEVLEDGTVVDNSKNREAVRIWADRLVKYMKNECDDEHMKSISFITGKNFSSYLWDPEIFKIEEMEFFGLHDYIFEMENETPYNRNRNLIVRHESINNLNVGLYDGGKIEHPEFQKRMFIYDEFGQTGAIPKQWPEDKHDDPTTWMNDCLGFHFKQDLWFTFAAGCAVAGLDWWNEDRKPRQKHWMLYFPGFNKFAADIDFENVNYTTVKEKKGHYYIAQRWPFTRPEIERSNDKPYRKSDKLESYIQTSEDGSQGFGWMMNRSYNWWNLKDSIECLNKLVYGKEPFARQYLYESLDSDQQDNAPMNIGEREAFIKVYNLPRLKSYRVDFYNTETGEIIKTVETRSSVGGNLKIYGPEMDASKQFDVAFKFYSPDAGWK